MADTTHTLETRLTAKDAASPAMKRAGAEGAKAARTMGKEADKAGSRFDRFKGKFLELGDAGKVAAGVAGTAFASMGASVSLATANMDSLAGSSAAAAGSIAAGFGSGGPVGGAIALASAGIGAIIFAFRQAGEEAKKAAEEAAKGLEGVMGAVTAAADGIEGVVKAARFERSLAERALIGNVDEELERLTARFGDMRREAVSSFNAAVEKANELAKALADDDLDDDVARELGEGYRKAVDEVERLRRAIGDLNGARRDEIRTIEARRELEQRDAERDRTKAAQEAARAAAEARRTEIQGLREAVGLRERLAGMDDIARQFDADRGMVMDLRLKGLNREADILEGIVNREERRLRLAKEQREEEERARRARASRDRIQSEAFAVKMIQARTEAEKLAVRHASERARFVGTEAERTAMILRQRAEADELVRRASVAAQERSDAEQKAADAYLASVREANDLLRATLNGDKERLEIARALADANERGGRAAMEAVAEQLRLQKEITAEAERQTKAKEQEAAFQSNLERMIAGGSMDKGLARRRNERRARNRLRKYRRAGQLDAEGNYVGGGIRNAPPGGAIWAGGTATGLGAPTQLSEGAGDMGTGSNRKTAEEVKAAAEEARAAADADLGLPDLKAIMDEIAAKEKERTRVVTGIREGAWQVRDNYDVALRELEQQNEAMREIAERVRDGTATQKEGREVAEAIHGHVRESNDATRETTEAQREVAAAVAESTELLRGMRDTVRDLAEDVQRLKDAANLKGGS